MAGTAGAQLPLMSAQQRSELKCYCPNPFDESVRRLLRRNRLVMLEHPVRLCVQHVPRYVHAGGATVELIFDLSHSSISAECLCKSAHTDGAPPG